MKIEDFPSPNYNKKKRPKRSIKMIVIHYTGMQSERESLYRLTSIKSKVSSHYLIGQYGRVFRLVKDRNIAWHAGKSCWFNKKKLNKSSIGIELVNKGHQFGYTNFRKKQLDSLIIICRRLIKKYKIKKKYIVGHSDIAPLRKKDPGEKFPWKKLAKKKIGIWHNFKDDFLKKFRMNKISSKQKKQFFKHIKNIGYCGAYKNKLFLTKVVKAFQRHYRQELISGIIDKECLIIASNLSKKT